MELLWDITNRQLVRSLERTARLNYITLSAGDSEGISVAVLTATGVASAPFVVTELAAGESVSFGAKDEAGLESGEYLFLVEGLSSDGSGDDLRYVGTANLATAKIYDHLYGDASDRVYGELTVITSAALQKYSTRFEIELNRDVIEGEASPPIPGGGGSAVQFYTDESGNELLRFFNRNGELIGEMKPPGV